MSAAADLSKAQDGAAPLIELRSVSKRYGRHLALKNVSFRVHPGEVVGLLGDNGAGKSTLIKMLSGINPPNSGEVLSDGRPASLNSRTESEALGIETIYQDIALVDGMDIMRNVFLGREFTNSVGFLRKAKMRQVAADVLKNSVDISGIRSPNQLVGDLSGGQKQAVAIARAVYFKKRLLLLDEPTSALSVRETNKVLEMIGGIKQSGASAVFVTHNIYHAYEVCDRFVVMSHGTVEREISKAGTSVAELTTAVINS